MSAFVNGTFDILHPAHLALLNYAKGLGGHLFVAIDNDQRVKQLKGPTRPVNDVWNRMNMLLNLKAVDEVIIFSSDEELRLTVQKIRPQFMVVGSDYKDKTVIGSEFAKNLVFFERDNEYSTTKTIQRIITR